jgi:hypothetical protein
VRRTWLLLVLLTALLVNGCASARALPGAHAELIAWYLEDLAHGLSRRPDELRVPDAGAQLQRVAAWADSNRVQGEALPPPHVAGRRERWPALSALFRSHLVVVLPAGLIAARPDLQREDRALALAVVDAENLDRRTLDGVMLSMISADDRVAAAYLEAVRRARVESDVKGGGEVWEGARR